MPIYEYRCEDCGKVVEVMQRLGDPELAECGEECMVGNGAGNRGTGRLKKMLSVTYGASGGSDGATADAGPGLCGACGRVPGSCGMDS